MTTDLIRANAERVAKTLFVPHAAARRTQTKE